MKACAILRALLPALLCATAATAAAAQETPPRDPVDDTTMRLGPFGFTPVINFHDIGRDNNVFNESTNPKSDFTATLSPKLDMLVHPGPLLLTVTTSSDYVYFQTYKSERGTNLASSIRADFAFGPLRPFVTVGGANTRDRLNREIDARARHHDRSFGAGVRMQIVEGVFATAGARRTTTAFDDDETFRGENLAQALNEQMDAIDAGVGVAITPLTTVSVTVTSERDRFELSPERDSDTLRIMPTVTFSPLAILNGTASFGYRRFTTLSPLVPDYHGFVSQLTLGTAIAEKHHLEGTFSRDVQYSYEEDAVYYIETGIQGQWTWEIAGPIDVHFVGSRSRLRYQGASLTDANNTDWAFTYGTGVAWRARTYLKFGVNGDWRQRTSERGADREFDNRRIYATVTWGKQ